MSQESERKRKIRELLARQDKRRKSDLKEKIDKLKQEGGDPLDAKRLPREKVIDSKNLLAPQDRNRNERVEIPNIHNLTTRPGIPKKCAALTNLGKPCKMAAKNGKYCTFHTRGSGAKVERADSMVYAQYIPSMKETMEDLSKIHENMWSEITLLRAILATALVRFEEGADVLDDVLRIIDLLRKTIDLQSRFLPNKRPVDEQSLTLTVQKFVNVLIAEEVDPNVLENVVIRLDTELAEIQQKEEVRALELQRGSKHYSS